MEVILVYTCDEWKSFSSMSLVGAFSTSEQLKRCITSLEKADMIELDDYYEDEEEKVKAVYEGDWSIYNLNNSYKYLYIEEITMNEINI